MQADKLAILARIVAQLRGDRNSAEQAVAVARDTATHPDALGSSKYETMGLEASYLAQGQGQRLLEIERALGYFSRLEVSDTDTAVLGSLVELVDEDSNIQCLWLAPEAGGLKAECGGREITVVTPKSPLGRALIGRQAGDGFELRIKGKSREYIIKAVR